MIIVRLNYLVKNSVDLEAKFLLMYVHDKTSAEQFFNVDKLMELGFRT
jgi:hypothetical protein